MHIPTAFQRLNNQTIDRVQGARVADVRSALEEIDPNIDRRNGAAGARAKPRLRQPAGQGSRLADPLRELCFIESVLVDVEVADVLVLGLAGRNRTQR